MKIGDKVYRFEYDFDGTPFYTTMFITKITPKAYFVNYVNVHEKGCYICYKDAIKKYAYLTLEEAFESFIARKKKQLKLLKSQIKKVELSVLYEGKMQEAINKTHFIFDFNDVL